VVCRSVTIVSPAIKFELIEMLFGMWTWVGPRKHIFHGVPCTTWRIRLNHPCAAAMWPYVKLLWSLVWMSCALYQFVLEDFFFRCAAIKLMHRVILHGIRWTYAREVGMLYYCDIVWLLFVELTSCSVEWCRLERVCRTQRPMLTPMCCIAECVEHSNAVSLRLSDTLRARGRQSDLSA